MSNPISTADAIRAVASKQSSGTAVDSNSVEDNFDSSEMSTASPEEDNSVDASESIVDDGLADENGNSEDTPTDSSMKNGAEAKSASKTNSNSDKKTSSKEVITVTDDKGRKQVEIDYENREATKKAYLMAHGARKWQAERDQAIQQTKQLQEKQKESDSNWEVFNKAWSENGIEGLVDLLEGRKGAYKDHINKQLDRADFLKKASPEEIEQLNMREALEKSEKERARDRAENEKFRKSMEEKEEQNQVNALKAKAYPVFEKYRFKGKLGNPEAEHIFDQMLYETTLKRLEPYEDQGLELTTELFEKEFRSVASTVRSQISRQAEKKASTAVQQQKQEATENVQAKVRAGYREGGTKKELKEHLNNGDLKGIFKNWGKFSGHFSK